MRLSVLLLSLLLLPGSSALAKPPASKLPRADLDNYARFTGYVYRPDGTTKEGGLEMLFPRLPSIRE